MLIIFSLLLTPFQEVSIYVVYHVCIGIYVAFSVNILV